jgi:hypothetical protein
VIDRNERVISGTVTGSAVTWTQPLNHNTAYSVQVKWSGTTIAGLCKLLVSLNGTDFVEGEDSQMAFTSNAWGYIWDVTEANYNWLRIHCESTSGAITFEAWLTLKHETPIGGG